VWGLWIAWPFGVLGPALVLATMVTLCVGHSVGLHRGIIHQTFRMPMAVQRVMVSLFVFTGLGGPLAWIRLHYVRDYWQNKAECPPYFAYRHSLAKDFYWNLHCTFDPKGVERYRVPDRWLRDPWLRFLERTWWWWNILLFGVLGWCFGLGAALVLGPLRVAGSILGHWFVGFWTHARGPKRFAIEGASEEGTNSTLLGWISFGEGYHINHHALPDSARMGISRFEFDLGWVVIVLLERLGLVRDVKSWCRGNAKGRVKK